MKTVIIVQARMGSTRLPGKVMKMINGIPIIELIVKRLKKSREANEVVVATSKQPENKVLINHLQKTKTKIFCGSENDVLDRFYKAANQFRAKIVVRITGDCPVVDVGLIDNFIRKFKNKKPDYLSNCFPPTFPDGLDIEIFSFDLLKKIAKKAKLKHRISGGVLISYLRDKDNYKKIKKINIECSDKKAHNYRICVDEEIDLALIRKIYEHFRPNIYFNWKQIMNFAKKNKKLFKINSEILHNEGFKLNKEQKLWKRATAIILGGNSLLSKNPDLFLPNKWPTYFTKSKGCKIWDLNNVSFIDMSLMGVGTNILGYCNSEVDNAVKKAVNKGNSTTLNCPEEVFLAEKLLNIHPWAGKVKFARTGGEASAIAVRIARAASKKDKIAFCGYHGWHDWYLSANISNKKNLDKHLLSGLKTSGVPNSLKNTSFPFNYNDFESLKKITDNNDIGVIIMEVERNMKPKNNFLKKIRDLATKKNIVLVFDEITSGFRETFGGLHKKYNVEPDIAIFGKALGNGYAIAAIIGKSSVMDYAQDTFISSALWSDRIGPVAAIKTLEIMERDKSWKKITHLGKRVFSIWRKLSLKNKLKINISGLPSLAKFNFNSKDSQAYKTFVTQEMLKYKFLAANGVYLSTSHNEKILKKYSEHLDEIFYKIHECEKGNLNISNILKYPVSKKPFDRLN